MKTEFGIKAMASLLVIIWTAIGYLYPGFDDESRIVYAMGGAAMLFIGYWLRFKMELLK